MSTTLLYRQPVRRFGLLAVACLFVSAVALCAGCNTASTAAWSPVKSWGNKGVVRLRDFRVNQILANGSGRVIVIGLYDGRIAEVRRLRPDGSLDPSFGKGGIVRWPYLRFFGWNLGAVLPDGKILLAGATRFGGIDTQSVLVMTELDDSGRVVKSFGRNGYFRTSQASCLRGPTGLALQGSRILVAIVHWCSYSSPFHTVLTRLEPGGNPDRSLGGAGSVVVLSQPGDYWGLPTPVVVIPGGRIAVMFTVGSGRVEIVGLVGSGKRDTHFGHGGLASAKVASDSNGLSVSDFYLTKPGGLAIGGCTGWSTSFFTRFDLRGRPLNFWARKPGAARSNVEGFDNKFGRSCPSFTPLPNGEFVVAAGRVLARLNLDGQLTPPHQIAGVTRFYHEVLPVSDGSVLITSPVSGTSYTTLIGRYTLG